MDGAFSVTFKDIYMAIIENEVVTPLQHFYWRYVDDIFNRRKRHAFQKAQQLSSKHPAYHWN